MGIGNDVKIIVKDVEIGADKVLNFLAKVQKATPAAVAGLGVLLGAVSKAVGDAESAVAAPLNISLDEATFADVKAVWPDIKAFVATLGIKL